MEEKNIATTEKQEKTTKNKNDWLERYKRFKEKAASNPDSIFILPFGGARGSKFVSTIINIGKLLNNIKKRAVFSIPMEVVKESITKVDTLADDMWKVTKKYVRTLYDFDRKQWRSLNDTVAEKNILAKRRNTFCIIPQSEEIGQIGIALKVLHKASIELQQDDLSSYEAMINDYLAMAEKAKSVIEDLKNIIENNQKKGTEKEQKEQKEQGEQKEQKIRGKEK